MANRSNPFDYMVAVVRNIQAVKAEVGRWMPWNYQEALPPLSGASQSP